MDQSVHSPQFLNVATDNVLWDNFANDFHHAVRDAGETIDRDDAVGLVIAVVGEVMCSPRL